MEYFDRIISLGQDCGVAGSLRKMEYKESTYPFDWNVTNMGFIFKCFRTKFKIFETVFRQSEKSGNGHLKYDNSIYFYHDTKNKFDKSLEQKYIKRGMRLHDLCSSNKKILFIRKGPDDNMKKIKKFIQLIIEVYPKLQFKILLINNIKEKNILPKYIIHKYKPLESFKQFSNDIWKHRDYFQAYKCVYEEISQIKSLKFKQPERKLDDIESIL